MIYCVAARGPRGKKGPGSALKATHFPVRPTELRAPGLWGTKPTGVKVRSPVAWLVMRKEIESLESNDKAVLGEVSELPGRNANECIGGLVILNRRSSPQHLGEGSIRCRKLTDAAA